MRVLSEIWRDALAGSDKDTGALAALVKGVAAVANYIGSLDQGGETSDSWYLPGNVYGA